MFCWKPIIQFHEENKEHKIKESTSDYMCCIFSSQSLFCILQRTNFIYYVCVDSLFLYFFALQEYIWAFNSWKMAQLLELINYILVGFRKRDKFLFVLESPQILVFFILFLGMPHTILENLISNYKEYTVGYLNNY